MLKNMGRPAYEATINHHSPSEFTEIIIIILACPLYNTAVRISKPHLGGKGTDKVVAF